MQTLFHTIKRLIIFILPSILTAGLLVLFFILFPSNRLAISSTGTQQVTPTSSITTSNDPIQTIESVSKQAIDSSNRTLQVVQWSVSIFVLSLLGIATNLTTSFSSNLKEATRRLDEIGQKFEYVNQELEETHKELESIMNNYLNLQQDLIAIESQTLPFDLATKAYENGKIDKEKYIESQAWYSWQKWKFGGDETGYKELLVHKKALNGLPKSIIRSAIAELIEINEKINKAGMANDQDFKNRLKLLKVLNLPEA